MIGFQETADAEPEQLGALLKRCRARINCERRSLGPYLRLQVRVGKPVTQEEVAEAAGITRQWYALMETDRAVRVSAAVLARIADALMMDYVERAALFRLAVPELRSAPLTNGSIGVLEAFGSLRNLVRRLWAASSASEALTIVREYAMAELAPDTVQTLTRVDEGRWNRVTIGDDRRAKRYDSLVQERWAGTEVDDLCCYMTLSQPGNLITRFERDTIFPALAAKERSALDAVGRSALSFAMASVRSPRGFVGRILAIHYTGHAYTDVERAQLSTLADVTSLALSGSAASGRPTRETVPSRQGRG